MFYALWRVHSVWAMSHENIYTSPPYRPTPLPPPPHLLNISSGFLYTTLKALSFAFNTGAE